MVEQGSSVVKQCERVWWNTIEQYGGRVEVWNSETVWKQSGGTVEQYSGAVEQCATVWNSMVEQWNSMVEQWNGGEQCGTMRWNVWNSVVEQREGTVWKSMEQFRGTMGNSGSVQQWNSEVEHWNSVVEQCGGTEEWCDGTV